VMRAAAVAAVAVTTRQMASAEIKMLLPEQLKKHATVFYCL
jgi:hypothetical protein